MAEDRQQAAVDELVQSAFSTMAVLTRVAAQNDLSLTQLRVLGILQDRRLRMSELAGFLGLDRSSLSGLVDRAEQRGLVERAPSPDDGRATEVTLSPAGRTLAARVRADVAAELTPAGVGRSGFFEPHVIFFSDDLTRVAAFYARLGFVEVFRTPSEGEPIHLDLELDGYRLGFASGESTRSDHGLEPIADGQRAAVIVWTEDAPAAWQALVRTGAPAVAAPHGWLDGRLLIAWTADPDGNPVQLVQRVSTTQEADGSKLSETELMQ